MLNILAVVSLYLISVQEDICETLVRIAHHCTAASAPCCVRCIVIPDGIALSDNFVSMERGNKDAALFVAVDRIIPDLNPALLFCIDRIGNPGIDSYPDDIVTNIIILNLGVGLFPDTYTNVIIVYLISPKGRLGEAAYPNASDRIIIDGIIVDLTISAESVTYTDGIIIDKVVVDLCLFCKAFMTVDADPHMFIAANAIIKDFRAGIQYLDSVTKDPSSSPGDNKALHLAGARIVQVTDKDCCIVILFATTVNDWQPTPIRSTALSTMIFSL